MPEEDNIQAPDDNQDRECTIEEQKVFTEEDKTITREYYRFRIMGYMSIIVDVAVIISWVAAIMSVILALIPNTTVILPTLLIIMVVCITLTISFNETLLEMEEGKHAIRMGVMLALTAICNTGFFVGIMFNDMEMASFSAVLLMMLSFAPLLIEFFYDGSHTHTTGTFDIMGMVFGQPDKTPPPIVWTTDNDLDDDWVEYLAATNDGSKQNATKENVNTVYDTDRELKTPEKSCNTAANEEIIKEPNTQLTRRT